MRFITRATMAAVAALMLAPQIADAGDVEAQLREMQERISELEGQLDATQAEVEASRVEPAENRVAIENSRVEYRDVAPDENSAGSGLSSFLESVEFSGWIAASYNYNFNGADNNKQKGQNSGQILGMDADLMPFHPDSNAFSVDQLWFEIDKAVNEDSRAGFHADLVFGKTAEQLDAGAGTGSIDADPTGSITFNNAAGGGVVDVSDLTISNSNDKGDLVKLYTAYLSYLAPIGNGVQFDAGKLPTLIGAEVAQSPYNFNITRGIVYSLQPITHTGIIVSTELMPGISISAGFVNDGLTDTNLDLDSNKAFTGQLAYSTDMFSVASSILYGSLLDSNERDKVGVFDVVFAADPYEDFSFWFDFTLQWNEDGVEVEGERYGVALAGRWAMSDRIGLAVRGEWVRDDPDKGKLPPVYVNDPVFDQYAVTGTLDAALTSHLQLRLEYRYDWTDSDARIQLADGSQVALGNYYWKGSGGADTNQSVALLEAIYTF